MKYTRSQTAGAKASTKYRMLHPEAVALNKIHWLRDPKNAEKQKMWQHAWKQQNAAHMREYTRLSHAISRARKSGDTALEQKLLVDRRCHCLKLRNRKSFGPMKPL